MIKRSNDGIAGAKLSTTNKTVSKIRSKIAEICSFIKQVWYVPFIWALAWFSYWIVQDIVIFGQPLTQANYFNYIGFTISIIAILAKGWISKKSIKKNIEKTKETKIDKQIPVTFHKTAKEMPSKESQYLGSEQLKPTSKPYSLIDKNQVQQPTETKMESTRSAAFTRKAIITPVFEPSQNTHQEIPSDCLMCPNLTKCDQRKKRANEPGTSCPFASIKTENESEQQKEPS